MTMTMHPQVGGFRHGLAHPLIGLDHLAAMILASVLAFAAAAMLLGLALAGGARRLVIK